MSEHRAVFRLAIVVAALNAIGTGVPCLAQPDAVRKVEFVREVELFGEVELVGKAEVIREAAVEEEGDVPAAAVMAFEYTDDMFYQWVYGTSGDGKDRRPRLDRLLELTVENIDRICTLAAGQKAKLQLAGRRDVQKFIERVEDARKNLDAVKSDQNRIGEILQEIQPLQKLLRGGLFADGSFFSKTLKTLLTPAQAVRQEREERERLAFQYEAKVHLTVAGLDDALALTDDQREKLVRLLLAETRPLTAASEFDYYVVLWQMTRVPEEKLRPLFEEGQWKALQKQTAQFAGMEEMLKQQGILPADDKPAEEKSAGDAPGDAPAKRADKGDTP